MIHCQASHSSNKCEIRKVIFITKTWIRVNLKRVVVPFLKKARKKSKSSHLWVNRYLGMLINNVSSGPLLVYAALMVTTMIWQRLLIILLVVGLSTINFKFTFSICVHGGKFRAILPPDSLVISRPSPVCFYWTLQHRINPLWMFTI